MKRWLSLILLYAVLLMCISGYASGEQLDATLLSVLDADARAFFDGYEDGAVVRMRVLLDQQYPEAVVTDPETIQRMIDALREVRVASKTDIASTDGYHFVACMTAEGKEYRIAFENRVLCAGGDRYVLENDADFWTLMESISDEYARMRIQGGPTLFDFFGDPEITAFAENFYNDPPTSLVLALHWFAASEYTVTDAETIAATFEALKQMVVGAQTDIMATDSDTYVIFRYDDGREFSFWFNFGNLCVSTDEHPYTQSYAVWGGGELNEILRKYTEN